MGKVDPEQTTPKRRSKIYGTSKKSKSVNQSKSCSIKDDDKDSCASVSCDMDVKLFCVGSSCSAQAGKAYGAAGNAPKAFPSSPSKSKGHHCKSKNYYSFWSIYLC